MQQIYCGGCKQDKNEDTFPPRWHIKDPIYPSERKCTECVRKNRRSYHNRSANKQRIKERTDRHRIKAKADVIAAYGGRCACCGEDNIVFLAIDHINGDMKGKHRSDKEMGTKLYTRLRREGYPKGAHRVLCHNCNFAEHVLGLGMCPHKGGDALCPA